MSYVLPPLLSRYQPLFKHNANQREVGNNTRSIATISDDHLEMLTRLRVRAASRAEARERIFAEASIILATLHNITNEPHPHQLQVVTLLHTMEQRMQDLIEEMGELALEEEHDTHIVTAIWGETGEWREH